MPSHLPIFASTSSDKGFSFSFALAEQNFENENFNLIVERKNQELITLQYALEFTACEFLNYISSPEKPTTKCKSSVFVFEIKNQASTSFIFTRLNDLLGSQNNLQRLFCTDSQMILFQIAQSKLKDEWLNLWLMGKAAELTACIHSCIAAENIEDESAQWLGEENRKKILQAQAIIVSQLHEPVPIKTLSRRVGLNENYLKRGFKEIFGKTLYQYFQDERMKYASNELKNSNATSVKEVAYSLGYTSVSHFSTAFKKSIGLLPCELIK